MKPIITIALLSGLALADKLPAGATCGTNVDCNKNCLISQWTLAKQGTDYAFVCDPNLADGTQYFTAECQKSTFGIQMGDRERTVTACTKVGGKLCDYSCVVTGSSRAPDATPPLWKKACADAGTQYSAISARASKENAYRLAGCPGSF
jgi:hypothetical protein